MRAFTTLPVLALAASAISPVLSTPIPNNQAQARAELEERALPIGQLFKYIAKQMGIGLAFSAVESAFTGGTTTSTTTSTSQSRRSFEPYYARDFSEERRADVTSLAVSEVPKVNKSFADYIVGGLASAIGFNIFGSMISHLHNHTTKRTPEPGLFTDLADRLGKTVAGTVASTAASKYIGSHGLLNLPRGDVSPAEVIAALNILDKREVPDEMLAALHKILSRAVNEVD